jgi:nucleotidyltransferase/DNA polymerase involved in DNA repair
VVPRFPVAVERLRDPALRGRPVVVGGAPEERKDVLDCSVEAEERGVRPGMTLREALSRCADAAFVEARPERYRATTLAMVEALLELSPLVEPAEPGVIYVGIDTAIPSAEKRPRAISPEADAMERELAETIAAMAETSSGLSVRVGVADGKFAAYVAAILGKEALTRQPSRVGSEA